MLTTLTVVALVLYLYGFYLQWQRLRNMDVEHSSGHSGALSTGLNIAAVLCHTTVAYSLMFTDQGFSISLVAVTNVVALVMVIFVAVGTLRLPVANLYLLLYPIAVVALAAALLVSPGSQQTERFTATLITHILLSLAAYSILMMAACQSALLAVQEHQLKSHNLRLGRRLAALLPPLESMEQLLLGMLWIGLILLTASIASGFIFLDNLFDQQVVHHTVLTSLSWLVYAFFLSGRYLFGWRGLTAVRWTLVAFALLVLGYFGSKFVLEYLIVQ